MAEHHHGCRKVETIKICLPDFPCHEKSQNKVERAGTSDQDLNAGSMIRIQPPLYEMETIHPLQG